ncbi:hypothetical protein Pyn_21738 [Prunus yedoensis var. nudiflora]|uniref:Uncharacterized protein n=1 Tax=Prunus yedoensis var. nudiflora TaxID=2094558 RepID=A0A314ZQS0_PRUYE|nr:hypothetical protein Pyn_21738 [Prunus yedoensis var. nudiflora]
MTKSKTRGEAGGASCSSKSREEPLMIPNSINFFSELEVNAIELLLQLSREKLLMIPNSINFFSELEVNAIELLVQLSRSSRYNGGSTEEESDGKSRAPPPPRSRPSSSSFKYETLSVDGDEEEDELSFGQRKKKFRLISDLYKQVDRAS